MKRPIAEMEGGSKRQNPWLATKTPNLIRYGPSGMFYLRGRFGGSPVRVSLETTNERDAKLKLEEKKTELRRQSSARAKGAPGTLLAAVAEIAAIAANDPTTKASTKEFYRLTLQRLEAGKKAALPEVPLARLSERDMTEWWGRCAGSYKPSPANQTLMVVRRALEMARKRGAITRNPSDELKRMALSRTRLELPTSEQFFALVKSVRGQQKAHSEEAGNWLEFMAYSGLRPHELREVTWGDIDAAAGTILVTGGKLKTKNLLTRHVPIIAAMRELLARMPRGEGKVFTIRKPTHSLKNACVNTGFPHQRIYNMRHLFATQCLESGVDVPTFAAWLGHQDGGALALKTYVQNRSDHRQAMAAKVKF